jgi:GTP pyrophosphokinase
VISAEWGGGEAAPAGTQPPVYPADIVIEAADRTGLLRDITEVLSREKINVTAVNTLSKVGRARMQFTVEITGVPQLQRTLKLVKTIPSVLSARRA